MGNHIIQIPQEATLHSQLSELGIIVKTSEDGTATISKEDIQDAGLSFEFFQAFAKLTQESDQRIGFNSTVARLLANRPITQALPTSTRLSSHFSDSSSIRDKELRLLLIDYFLKEHSENLYEKGAFAKLWDQLNDPSLVQISQETLNQTIDEEEARVLSAALRIIENLELEPENTDKAPAIQLAKQRINDLGENSCWLGVEALRVGLLGSINGELDHKINAMILGLALTRETTMAHEFQCTYLPSMYPVTQGLSYSVDTMGPKLQKTAASGVRIETDYGHGSGVAALKPGYILTAKHVVNNLIVTSRLERLSLGKIDSKPLKIPFTLVIGEEKLPVEAEVIEIEGTPDNPHPDLVMLHVPEIKKRLKPLQFSEQLKWRDNAIRSENDTVFSYVIGYPYQKPPNDKLVTPGQVIFKKPSEEDKKEGVTKMSAPTIPGNSGGAVVDESGNLLGIATQLSIDEKALPSMRKNPEGTLEKSKPGQAVPKQKPPLTNYFYKYFDKTPFKTPPSGQMDAYEALRKIEGIHDITGGRMYTMALWGDKIKKAIDNHQKSNRTSKKK